jgi:hypothetical protein
MVPAEAGDANAPKATRAEAASNPPTALRDRETADALLTICMKDKYI